MNLYWKVEDSFVFMASNNFCKFFVKTIWHGVLSRTEKTEPNYEVLNQIIVDKAETAPWSNYPERIKETEPTQL